MVWWWYILVGVGAAAVIAAVLGGVIKGARQSRDDARRLEAHAINCMATILVAKLLDVSFGLSGIPFVGAVVEFGMLALFLSLLWGVVMSIGMLARLDLRRLGARAMILSVSAAALLGAIEPMATRNAAFETKYESLVDTVRADVPAGLSFTGLAGEIALPATPSAPKVTPESD